MDQYEFHHKHKSTKHKEKKFEGKKPKITKENIDEKKFGK